MRAALCSPMPAASRRGQGLGWALGCLGLGRAGGVAPPWPRPLWAWHLPAPPPTGVVMNGGAATRRGVASPPEPLPYWPPPVASVVASRRRPPVGAAHWCGRGTRRRGGAAIGWRAGRRPRPLPRRAGPGWAGPGGRRSRRWGGAHRAEGPRAPGPQVRGGGGGGGSGHEAAAPGPGPGSGLGPAAVGGGGSG